MAHFLLDAIPPTALLLVTGGLAVGLRPHWGRLPARGLAAACLGCPALYALGTGAFLAAERWAPAGALASLAVVGVPLALVASLHAARRWLGIGWGALGLSVWATGWAQSLIAGEARSGEPARLGLFAGYWLGSLVLVGWGARASGLPRRVAALASPLLLLAALVGALQAGELIPRGPALPALTLVAAIAVLYLLLKEADAVGQAPSSWLGHGLVALLLALGALVAFGLAANLGLLPRAPGAVAISAGLATALAFGYAAFLPGLQAVLEDALYPEARAAREQADALERELEEARERLQRAEQRVLVGELAAQVAHEIKNPLGPIKGYAAVIEREAERAGALSEKLARGLEVIRAEVEAIDARAQALLELARGERGGSAIWAPLDLLAALEGELERGRAAYPTLSWSWGERPHQARVLGDPLLVRSTFANLLQNAAQAGAQRVELAVRAQGEEWLVTVRDDGPGLPLEPSELLKPFVTRRPGGTGLGLAIARGAARALGGELRLGPGPAGGAEVEVRLPRPPGEEPCAA